jgi:hypothetical protein
MPNTKLKPLDRPACRKAQLKYRYAPANAALRTAAGATVSVKLGAKRIAPQANGPPRT